MENPPKKNRYSALIEKIFLAKYRPGGNEVDFAREDITRFAHEMKMELPKNLGDVIYSFRYRSDLPETIQSRAGKGSAWIIRPAGRARYRFVRIPDVPLTPNEHMVAIKVPDATPGIVAKYALSDEQALLAKIRYNRLVDIFLGVTCCSLQNHLRTSVPGMGQVETDEIYVGLDKKGNHYIVPVQAKGRTDRLSIVQIEQDVAVCAHKFPSLICRPMSAQFMKEGVIALIEFGEDERGLGVAAERHYRLVPPDQITNSDLESYRKQILEGDSAKA